MHLVAVLTLVSSAGAASVPSLTAARQDTVPADTAYKLADLSVTATRGVAASSADQPAALSVVRPSLKEMTGGRVAADLFRDIPGVWVQQTSAGQGSVILRGMTGNQVLLLIDGVPLNNGTYRDGPGQYLATVDPATIERIEVIRGPGSVLYGSDAQGGVVNLITRSHPESDWNSVRLAANASSSNHGGRMRSSMSFQQDRFVVAFGGSFSSAGDLRPGGGVGPQAPTGFDTWGADASVSFYASDTHTFSGTVQHFRMSDVPRYDRYVNFRAPALGSDALHVFDPQIRQHIRLRHAATPSSWLQRLETTVSISTQREGRTRQRLDANGAPRSTITQTQDNVVTPGISIVGTSIATLAGRSVNVTAGGDFYHDQLNASGLVEDVVTGSLTPVVRETVDGRMISSGRFPDNAEADRLGAFVLAEAPIVPALRLSLGARWSRFRNEANVGREFGGFVSGTASDLTGQIGVVASLTSRWKVALRVAEGFRAPNLYDLTNVGSAPGGIVVPNPDATPERSLSTELSVRYGSSRGAFNVTGYRITIDDFIDRAAGVFNGDTLYLGERVLQGRNLGDARVAGFEAEGVVRAGSAEFRATVLYTRGEQTGADGATQPMAKIPPLGGTGQVLWRSGNGQFWVDYTVRWATRQDRLAERDMLDSRIPDNGTPGFFVQGMSGGAWVSNQISVTLSVENLTDELYRNHASGVDNPGRHLSLGVNLLSPF